MKHSRDENLIEQGASDYAYTVVQLQKILTNKTLEYVDENFQSVNNLIDGL